MSIVLIAPPASEPVSVAQLLTQMGFGTITDGTLNATLTSQLSTHLTSARTACEAYCRRAFITQRWQYRRFGFDGHKIMLPVPPLQSIDWMKYVDTSGTVQTLLQDTTYGNNPPSQRYGYQLQRGSETQPAFLTPPWAQPWPPTRLVPDSVLLQMRVGYGQPIIASIAANSTALSANVTFNPDDAPLMAGETGLPISISEAVAAVSGGAPTTLNTYVASVDAFGNATLAAPATATVANGYAWAGAQVPYDITSAILLLAQWMYEQASVGGTDIPEWIMCKLKPFRNLVS